MSVRLWYYNPDICDGDFCPNNCDNCYKRYQETTEEEDEDEDS